jgi:class 3 adenylate cyclase
MHPWSPGAPATPLRPWQRLALRLVALLAGTSLLAAALVGAVTYQRQRGEVEDGVGTQLLNVARVTALLVDPALHARVQREARADSAAYRAIQERLRAAREEALLTTPVYTLAGLDPARGSARLVVVSDRSASPGDPVTVAPAAREPLRWTFEDGVARYTRVYADGRGRWISAFAPIAGPGGRVAAVVGVDYEVDIVLDRLGELRRAILGAAAAGAAATLLVGAVFARRLTRPIAALTAAVGRVAAGDLDQRLPVRSRDELGRLTAAFNGMVEGLRQRDVIRSAFGRYVSPEVAQQLLDAPDGLRLGGRRRTVTVLMSDLRGYTRFAERGEPEQVMDVLNLYLARMTALVVEHGGTINEFIGDAIFAVFGAPLAHPDHAARAARCALAMQRAMAGLEAELAGRGLPRFEMGIGLHTGEAVVGNIGSEQRAKYAVVGGAVNVAARVEAATVGGQVYLTAATLAALGARARVAPPVVARMKGLAEPLALYELRGVDGDDAPGAPDGELGEPATPVPVDLWVLEGKIVSEHALAAVALRVGPRGLLLRCARPLEVLDNLRLRLRPPGESALDEAYGKVVGLEPGPDGPRVRVRFTALDEADRRRLERLAAGGAAGAAAPARAAAPERG